ncbi:MAG: hypothetical protein IPG85_12030 [Bacteroidetes bacterium]|jgi:hypothetical protein|nr:hypothetical protein [Bacteroidota bacterium]
MFSYFKNKKDAKFISKQIDTTGILLTNVEMMTKNNIPTDAIKLELQKVAFLYTIGVLKQIDNRNISINIKIKTPGGEIILAHFVKFFMDKSLEIAKKINFDENKLQEIFSCGNYYRTLISQYENGELEFN